MLVRFSVQNFLSFRDRAELSMISANHGRSPQHVVEAATSDDISLLKAAAIYGANASGKSNLVRAIDTVREMVVEGVRPGRRLPITPFKLDSESENAPSRFEFEIKVGDRYFAYGLSATHSAIVEEWLYEIGNERNDPVFERTNTVEFVFPGVEFRDEEQKQFLTFTSKGTPKNRLFLSECKERRVQDNVEGLDSLFQTIDWFERVLFVIFPHSKYGGLEFGVGQDDDFRSDLSNFLRSFDTGIEEIALEEVDFDKLEMPEEIKNDIREAKQKDAMVFAAPGNRRYYVAIDEKGNIQASRLIVRRRKRDEDAMATFGMEEESDGTLRMLDLVPGLLALLARDCVFIVDELDRSLHPDISLSFVKNFLRYSEGKQSQLIVTTHETRLLQQEFLRRDEIWFVDKGRDHSSKLTALEEFASADREDVRNSYLQGRFGGVPVLHDLSWLKK